MDKMFKNPSRPENLGCITFIVYKDALNVDLRGKIVYYYIRRIMDNYPILLHRYGEPSWIKLLKSGKTY